MTKPWFPEAGVDFDRANAARMYDYYLGGAHNFAVDRNQAAKVLASYPDAPRAARANRAFLGNAVRWCQAQGIDQFLDLGSGVPTVGNIHEIAHGTDPNARVAYVDFEPVAVAHAQEILADVANTTVTRADLRDPERVLTSAGVAGLLDFSRPVAVLLVAVLHFVARDAERVLASYRAALAPGSAIVLSHSSADQDDPALAAQMHAMIEAYRGSATELTLRSRAELLDLLAPLRATQLEPPGLVDVTDWPSPATPPAPVAVYGAVARIGDEPAT